MILRQYAETITVCLTTKAHPVQTVAVHIRQVSQLCSALLRQQHTRLGHMTNWCAEYRSLCSCVLQALGFAFLKAVIAIVGITAGGRILIRPLYKKISNLANAEIFAATTLLVVLGTSFMTQLAGESSILPCQGLLPRTLTVQQQAGMQQATLGLT